MTFDVNRLFILEENSKILDFKITSLEIPVWLLVRHEVLIKLLELFSGINYSHAKVNFFKLKNIEKIKYIYNVVKNLPFFTNKKYPILIIGEAVNNVIENGYYYNRLYDPIYELISDKALLLETSAKFTYYTPRFNKNLRYHDIIDIIPRLTSKLPLIRRIDRKEEVVIEKFSKYLLANVRKLFKIDFSDYISYRISVWKHMPINYEVRSRIYKYLINKIKPRLVIIGDAHYGRRADLIAICKKLKIKTAEIQHGIINSKHLAYNYHENVKEEVQKYLPDYMLFWGDYWASLCNTPSKKLTIGFPYLEKKVKEYNERKKDIDVLMLSSGSIPDEYIALGKQIKAIFQDRNLVLRPHPSELPFATEKYKSLLDIGWRLDTGNLYETLSRAKFCLSLEMTTTLYEALCFCDKVFLLKTNASAVYMEENLPFNVLENAEQVLKHLLESPNINKVIRVPYIFAENSVEKLQTFFEKENIPI